VPPSSVLCPAQLVPLTVTADFGSTTLVIQTVAGGSPTDFAPETFIFTDTAFVGLTLTKTGDTFPGGLTATLVGDVLTVNTVSLPADATYQGSFTLTAAAAVPEPSSIVMAATGALGASALAMARSRKFRKS
jgi:PEP-CTERM motif